MMETILRIALTDVQRLSFECKGCGTVLSLKYPNWPRFGSSCSQCHKEWLPIDDTTTVSTLRGLELLADKDKADQLRFVLRLEIPAPDAQS